jgi:hypothetical protein
MKPPQQVHANSPTASQLSECQLNSQVNSLRTMRANLKGPVSRPGKENQASPAQVEEDRRRAAEATKRVIERELSNYILEPTLESSSDTPFQDILRYWQVC